MPVTKNGISLASETPAGSTEKIEYDPDNSGYITWVEIRIYVGAETDLNLDPYIQTEIESKRKLIEYVGKDGIDGDDDSYTFNVNVPIEDDAKVVVEADNTDPDNAHSWRVNMDFERGEI